VTYIVGASIRLHPLQVLVHQWRRFRSFPKSRSRYWRTFSRQPRPVCCNRLGDIATCSKVVLWARHVQTQPSGSRTPSHILKAKVPPVRGLISGRDTCKPSLREADHLHRFSRQHCHSSECCSLGARRANPAFGKPNTSFTFLTATAASVQRSPIQQRYLYSASNLTSHVTTTAASLQLSSDRRPYWLQRFRQRTQCH
jgi:hypothetical protein